MAYHIPTYCRFVYLASRYTIGILMNKILLDDSIIDILVFPEPLYSPLRLSNHPMKKHVNNEYFVYSSDSSISLSLAVDVNICIAYLDVSRPSSITMADIADTNIIADLKHSCALFVFLAPRFWPMNVDSAGPIVSIGI